MLMYIRAFLAILAILAILAPQIELLFFIKIDMVVIKNAGNIRIKIESKA